MWTEDTGLKHTLSRGQAHTYSSEGFSEARCLNLKFPLMFCGRNKSLWRFILEVEDVNIGYGQWLKTDFCLSALVFFKLVRYKKQWFLHYTHVCGISLWVSRSSAFPRLMYPHRRALQCTWNPIRPFCNQRQGISLHFSLEVFPQRCGLFTSCSLRRGKGFVLWAEHHCCEFRKLKI